MHGSDFIRQDPSGKHVRLDVNSILKDTTGAIIAFKYSGVIALTPSTATVLGGSPDAKTTGFGDACEFSGFWFEWLKLRADFGHSYARAF